MLILRRIICVNLSWEEIERNIHYKGTKEITKKEEKWYVWEQAWISDWFTAVLSDNSTEKVLVQNRKWLVRNFNAVFDLFLASEASEKALISEILSKCPNLNCQFSANFSWVCEVSSFEILCSPACCPYQNRNDNVFNVKGTW